MAKRKSSNEKYTSKGQHSNVSSGTRTAMRKSVSQADRLLNLKKAWRKGLNPWITISNPNKAETNRKFIRVRTNEHWGDPKKIGYIVPGQALKAEVQ